MMRGDGVQILNRVQRGEWYSYRCAVKDDVVSFDIPCEQIQTRSPQDAEALVKRNAEALAQAQQEGLVGR